MAQDATGTPTSLGIPTYDVNQDAPTGNGFNAAMAAIDALVKARIADPSTQNDGEPLVWDSGTLSWKPVHVKINDVTKYLRGDGTWAAPAAGMPTGALAMFGAAVAPSGWLLCDGSAVSRTTYSALFGVIATTYGAGDGTTTFNVPNGKGRMLAGLDSGQAEFAALAQSGGFKTQSHTHTVTVTAAASTSGGPQAAGNAGTFTSSGPSDTNNLPPYLVVNFIIKT